MTCVPEFIITGMKMNKYFSFFVFLTMQIFLFHISLSTLFFLSVTVNTHCHADHITSTGLMKKRLVGLKSAISKFSGATADILLSENDKITFGKHVRSTDSSYHSYLSIVCLSRKKKVQTFLKCGTCAFSSLVSDSAGNSRTH